jgi:hypothetical protein
MSETSTIFVAAGLNNLANLYNLCVEREIQEIGSPNIHPDFAPTCNHVRKIMLELGGVKSSGEKLYAVWQKIDNDGMFNLSGYKQVESILKFVQTPEYLEIFASLLKYMDAMHLRKVNDFSKGFCEVMTSIKQRDVRYEQLL